MHTRNNLEYANIPCTQNHTHAHAYIHTLSQCDFVWGSGQLSLLSLLQRETWHTQQISLLLLAISLLLLANCYCSWCTVHWWKGQINYFPHRLKAMILISGPWRHHQANYLCAVHCDAMSLQAHMMQNTCCFSTVYTRWKGSSLFCVWITTIPGFCCSQFCFFWETEGTQQDHDEEFWCCGSLLSIFVQLHHNWTFTQFSGNFIISKCLLESVAPFSVI